MRMTNGMMVMVALMAMWNPASAADQHGVLNTKGLGTALVAPDHVSLDMEIAVELDTASGATDSVVAILGRVVEYLEDFGFGKEALVSERFNVHEIRARGGDSGKKEVIGYRASKSLKLNLDKIDRLNELSRAMYDSGVRFLKRINFESSKKNDAYQEALAQAVRANRHQAEIMAREAGGRLGDLIEMSTESRGGATVTESVDLNAVTETHCLIFAPERLEVSAWVTASWEFVP